MAYAVMGKGFAYVGIGPLFVTEAMLAAGLLVMLRTGCSLAALLNLPSMILAALMLWVLYRTLPFVGPYGFDALRDSVLVMYGLFSFVVAALLLQKPVRVLLALHFLRVFTTIFVVAAPLIYAGTTLGLLRFLPTWPGSGVPILAIRVGEMGVHLSACAVMAALGLRTARPLWIAALALAILLVASQNRGGLLAIVLPTMLALPFTRVWRRVLMWCLAGVGLLALAYAADLQMPARTSETGRVTERPLGARQAVDNVLSLAISTENRQLDDTKTFRVAWWTHILNYTLHGRYFWIGKGFGVNLAVDDGFVVGDRNAAPLRSPHNSHMNVLARTGIPGMVLWLAFLVSWFVTVMGGAARAWRAGESVYARLMLFCACYWLSNVINATFDVALEGPMLGVWFWCQTGFGLGLVAIHQAQIARLRVVQARAPISGLGLASSLSPRGPAPQPARSNS